MLFQGLDHRRVRQGRGVAQGPAFGHVAEQHLIAVVAALEEHYAGHGELRAIEETLAGLETEAGPPGGSCP